MRNVKREDVVEIQEYLKKREAFTREVAFLYGSRTIDFGSKLKLRFENSTTILFQIQEWILSHNLTDETEIANEISCYNGILGNNGEISCTCFLKEIDPNDREINYFPKDIFVKLDQKRVFAQYDLQQKGAEPPSIQYLRFYCGDQVPKAIGCDSKTLVSERILGDLQRESFRADLET